MRRSSRNNAICFESLEEVLAKSPKTYRHLDLLCGGWPCQDNSIAGTRKGHAGEKSGLWREVRRLLELFRPRWFIGENVPGLFSVRAGEDFWGVISDLDLLGYCVAWDVLDSQNFGLAQRRKRVFIVASFGNIGAGKIFFKQEGSRGDIAKKGEVGIKGICLSTRDGERQDPKTENIVANTIGANEGRKNHPTTESFIIGTIRSNWGIKSNADRIIANAITGGQRGIERTRCGNYIAEINTNGKRETPRTAGKLDTVRGLLIGNAVSVPIAEWIGKRIIEIERNNPAG